MKLSLQKTEEELILNYKGSHVFFGLVLAFILTLIIPTIIFLIDGTLSTTGFILLAVEAFVLVFILSSWNGAKTSIEKKADRLILTGHFHFGSSTKFTVYKEEKPVIVAKSVSLTRYDIYLEFDDFMSKSKTRIKVVPFFAKLSSYFTKSLYPNREQVDEIVKLLDVPVKIDA